ncbi:MAG: tetratricopeptide repeat protein [Nitrospirae bacterium]|nr:tetratricopeptide repeat protein [Nitrospirota bacterium]
MSGNINLFGYSVSIEHLSYAGALLAVIIILLIYRATRKNRIEIRNDEKPVEEPKKEKTSETLKEPEQISVPVKAAPLPEPVKNSEPSSINTKQAQLREGQSMSAVIKLFPQIEHVERLENYEALYLSAEEIKKSIAALLDSVSINDGAIDPRSDEKDDKVCSDLDSRVLFFVAECIEKIDARYGKPVFDYKDYLMLGNAEFYGKKYEKAAEYYDRAVKARPDSIYALNNLGVALDDVGNGDEALNSFDAAIEISPSFAEAWYGKGYTLAGMERFEEAAACYDKALEIKAMYADVWYDRGVAMSSLGRHEDALKCFETASILRPMDAKVWHGKAIELSVLGLHEDAYKSYDAAINIKSDDGEAWYGKGIALNYLESYEAALQCFDFSLAINSGDAKSWFGRGTSLRNLGLMDEALHNFDKAVSIDPLYARAWFGMARICSKKRDRENAIKYLTKAVAIDRKHAEKAAVNEDFRYIREDDEFKNLLRAIEPEA